MIMPNPISSPCSVVFIVQFGKVEAQSLLEAPTCLIVELTICKNGVNIIIIIIP
jgi:hypothetical protein